MEIVVFALIVFAAYLARCYFVFVNECERQNHRH